MSTTGPPLTARQRAALLALRRSCAADGWPVGPAGFARQLGVGRGRAKMLLSRLYVAGYLEHRPFTAGGGLYRPRPGVEPPAEDRPPTGRAHPPAVVAAVLDAARELVRRRRWPAVRVVAAMVRADKHTVATIRARLVAAGRWPECRGLRRGSGAARIPAADLAPERPMDDAARAAIRAAKAARGETPTGTRTVRVPRVHRCHAPEAP
jgi:hypothetical protein